MILETIVDISTNEIDRTFDYEGDDIPIGSRVAVDFGKKHLIGFVIGKKDVSEFSNLKKAKYLDSPLTDKQIDLMYYMREKFNLRFIDILRLLVPAKLRSERDPQAKNIYLEINKSIEKEDAIDLIGTRSKKQLEAYDYLLKINKGCFLSDLTDEFGAAVIKGLRDKNVIVETLVHKENKIKALDKKSKEITLTEEQKNAVNSILSGTGVYLLHGVTGSGKTEVYMAVIEALLKQGKGSIFLVPEISLTPQMFAVFKNRFGDNIAIIHSGLNVSERYDEWKKLYDGTAKIAIGARSAVFSPIKNLGAIIIDEEHDSSYISESNPRFDTKTIAEFIGYKNDAVVVLGSATPDIETYQNAASGIYKLLELPNRISIHNMPDMDIVNMTDEYRFGNRSLLSRMLQTSLVKNYENGNQAMIFLNRRGYASFIRCNACGYIAKCENCDVSLTYHASEDLLKCHYCGARYKAITKCPTCGNTNLKNGKVGTEKVVEEIKNILPDAKILRMDNDTTSTKDATYNILSSFEKGEANVLVGTQMIAKGHDFPNVTLVGILEADSALYFSDYRSSERTFQIVTQVAGRAGRADKEGKVILQTYNPKHYVFKYAKNYDYVNFYKKEVNTREVTKFPPFTKIVRILVNAEKEDDVIVATRSIYEKTKDVNAKYGFVYIGANKSPVLHLKGYVRYQILMRIKPKDFDEAIKEIYAITDDAKSKNKNVNIFVEINPQSLI